MQTKEEKSELQKNGSEPEKMEVNRNRGVLEIAKFKMNITP
jgi:hypothetical protein